MFQKHNCTTSPTVPILKTNRLISKNPCKIYQRKSTILYCKNSCALSFAETLRDREFTFLLVVGLINLKKWCKFIFEIFQIWQILIIKPRKTLVWILNFLNNLVHIKKEAEAEDIFLNNHWCSYRLFLA